MCFINKEQRQEEALEWYRCGRPCAWTPFINLLPEVEHPVIKKCQHRSNNEVEMKERALEWEERDGDEHRVGWRVWTENDRGQINLLIKEVE